jgi:hypothetical protein
MPVVGKWLVKTESKGGSFSPCLMQCTNTPGTFWNKIVTVYARADNSWSLILSFPFLIKDTVIKWGPGPEPGSVVPSKKSGSASTVLLSDGDGFNITGAKLDVQRLDLVVLGGDDVIATVSL